MSNNNRHDPSDSLVFGDPRLGAGFQPKTGAPGSAGHQTNALDPTGEPTSTLVNPPNYTDAENIAGVVEAGHNDYTGNPPPDRFVYVDEETGIGDGHVSAYMVGKDGK